MLLVDFFFLTCGYFNQATWNLFWKYIEEMASASDHLVSFSQFAYAPSTTVNVELPSKTFTCDFSIAVKLQSIGTTMYPVHRVRSSWESHSFGKAFSQWLWPRELEKPSSLNSEWDNSGLIWIPDFHGGAGIQAETTLAGFFLKFHSGYHSSVYHPWRVFYQVCHKYSTNICWMNMC